DQGPVRAPAYPDVLHSDTNLILHLALYAAHVRFAVFHDACHERVAAVRPDGLAGDQHAVAVAHHHDDRRVQVGVVFVFALRTQLAPLTGQAFGRMAAARAEAARRLPPEGLHGHPAEREEIVGQTRARHRHERLALE